METFVLKFHCAYCTLSN